KANFISTVGEVCVVPWTSEDKFFDKTYISQTDLIFVRNLNSNQWRNFVYLGIEKPEDFKEFFPDFPKSIKLSAATANGQYATTNQVYEISTNMLKFLFKSELSPAVVEEINNTIKDAEERLKVNGFNE
ncbi:MAG: hypothetical protein RSC03_12070, partial [Acinetobacter sp.]